jgi:sporulation protein YlmC with PRC-barrel domain
MASAQGRFVMRLSDLQDKKVRTLDGEMLGRVHEVHCDNGAVTALTCGPGSLIERLTAREHGRRIPWECVRKVDPDQILVTPDPPKRKLPAKTPSGSRTRQRTPRPSGRRSGR